MRLGCRCRFQHPGATGGFRENQGFGQAFGGGGGGGTFGGALFAHSRLAILCHQTPVVEGFHVSVTPGVLSFPFEDCNVYNHPSYERKLAVCVAHPQTLPTSYPTCMRDVKKEKHTAVLGGASAGRWCWYGVGLLWPFSRAGAISPPRGEA